MSDKPTLDYERPKLVPSKPRAWHYAIAGVVAVAGAACAGFLLSLLSDSLPGNEFTPRIIGRKLISGGTVLAGIIAFKLVLNGFKPKEPRNW